AAVGRLAGAGLARAAGPAARSRHLLEHQLAAPRRGRTGPGDGVLSVGPGAVASELSPRWRVGALRRRLPRPATSTGQRRGCVLRWQDRGDAIAAVLSGFLGERSWPF